ncbi:MAG: transposase, partial [Candidatus Woesearchaeota archaeon]
LVNKVRNGKQFWFTCILYPEAEPTNNSAERGLRKFVVIKKIIGCLRSEQGKRNMQVMLSVFQTWRLQGLNPYKELRAIL